MTRRLVLGCFAGVAALLVLLIGFELMPRTQPTEPLAADAHLPAAAVHPSATASVSKEVLVQTMLDRPLFNPNRRPEMTAGPVTAASTDDSTLPRLSGIMVSGTSKQAIFQSGADDKPIVVAEGDEISSWTVQTISGAGVVLVGPDGTQTLQPTFDPNAKPADPAMPAMPPQAPKQILPGAPQQSPNGPRQPVMQPFDPRRLAVPPGMPGAIGRRAGATAPGMLQPHARPLPPQMQPDH